MQKVTNTNKKIQVIFYKLLVFVHTVHKLYSKDYDDIYHSASGALTEAYEKFVCPVNWDNLLKYDDIKVLDICYGIGYNTKSFLNYIFELKLYLKLLRHLHIVYKYIL